MWSKAGCVTGAVLAVALVAATLAPVASGRTKPRRPRCLGLRATIVGTSRPDRLRGTSRPDVIAGLGGADSISGLAGDDTICGGAGNDRIDGGDGADRADGGAGRNRCANVERRARCLQPDEQQPQLVSATVTATHLTLHYDEALTPAVTPDPLDLLVTLDGASVAAIGATVSGQDVAVELAAPAYGDDAVTLDYDPKSERGIADLAGNYAESFYGLEVRNESPTGCTSPLEALPPNPGGEAPTDFSTYLRPEGVVQAVMLFVDFSDAPATEDVDDLYARTVPTATRWFSTVSYGRLQLHVTPVRRWFRMALPASAYPVTRENPNESHQLMHDAVAVADPFVDFTPYRLVYVFAAPTPTITTSPAFVEGGDGIRADGVSLRAGALLGPDTRIQLDEWGTYVFAHETGHTFGLPDLYDYTGTVDAAGGWDLMGHLLPPGLLAWHRWKLGWLRPEQLRCVRKAPIEDTLTPIERAGGTKALVAPLSRDDFLVAEVRAREEEDATLCSAGVLVYRVNVTTPTGRNPVRVIAAGAGTDPAAIARCGGLYAAPFGAPSTFEDAQAKVEVLGTDGASYRVRMTRKAAARQRSGQAISNTRSSPARKR